MEPPRRNRRRLPRSCEECRRRKVKCDRNQPCSHCVLTKVRCLYKVNRHGPPAGSGRLREEATTLGNDYPLHQVGETRQELNESLRQQQGSDSSTPMVTSGDCSPSDQFLLRPLSSSQPRNPLNRGVFGGTAPWTPSSHQSKSSIGNQNESASNLQSASDPTEKRNSNHQQQLVLNKSRLFGRTHWTNAVYEFEKIAAFMRIETTTAAGRETIAPLNVAIRTLLHQCKSLSQSAKPQRPGRALSRLEPIVPSAETSDHLIHVYQSSTEPFFRILHRPSFQAEYELYKAGTVELDDVTMLKIQLAMAIGFGFSPELAKAKDMHKRACQWLYAAQDWLSGPMEKNRLSIAGIQVHCLLILARQVLSVGGDLSWVAMGTLLRTALQLGFHRDPKHFPRMSVFEAEMRRRLWATILELNTQASLDSGTPPGISYDDFDTSPPANLNDEDIGADSTSLKQVDDEVQTDTSMQRFLLQHLPPRLEILGRMNGFGMVMNDERTLDISAKLNAACRQVESQTPAGTKSQTAMFETNMTCLLLRRFLLVLHRPLAGRIKENALYYHSRKVSFDTAMALLNPPLSDAAFRYIMLRGGGLFKSCLIHASLAVASELLIEMEENGSNTYRQMLIDAVKEAGQQWEQRLEFGETNVRLHMKLGIVLSQAEDAEDAGQAPKQRMAQSAKDSLELCYRLMKDNLDDHEGAACSPESPEWDGQGSYMHGSSGQSEMLGDPLHFDSILDINSSAMNEIFNSDGLF
ncbi:fungal-specific transcription factor domain-containing protein [Astrocystis sublimbata]|nr:fungal-specific transcription factor domain-containing protein [Astrocystis sublimbata]